MTLEFRESGKKDLVLPEVPARWSSRPEPLRTDYVDPDPSLGLPKGAQLVRRTPDPALVPQTLVLDLPASGRWEEVAVAVLKADGEAYAWGAESYLFSGWRNPVWRLQRGTYDVTVRLEASGATTASCFKLDNLTTDFARFELRTA